MKQFLINMMIIILCTFNLLNAQDLKKQIRFANELFNAGEYYRAITEFYRINSYFPENEYFIDNYYKIAKSYYLGGHLVESNNIYKKILTLNKNNWESIFNIAKNYNEMSYYSESNIFINENLNIFFSSRRDSLLFISAINHINLSEYQLAEKKFHMINTDEILMLQAGIYVKNLNENLPLKCKNKVTGIIIGSIIPGGGYFYVNRYQTGLSAIFVNLLFGYATYNSFKNDNYSLGFTLGIFSASFYLGSIYGTMQAIQNYNKSIQINFLKIFKL